jgi:hypothetical protein
LKTEQLNLRQVIKERERSNEELERKTVKLEVELQENAEKQKKLIKEKNKLINDNLDLTKQLRQSRTELSKLQAFRKAIINTVGDEEEVEEAERQNSVLQLKSGMKSPRRSNPSSLNSIITIVL